MNFMKKRVPTGPPGTSPIYKVPEDIIVSIFETADTDGCHDEMATYFGNSSIIQKQFSQRDFSRRRPKRPLVNMYGVCRSWKHLIDNIPRLWLVSISLSIFYSSRRRFPLEAPRKTLVESKGSDIHLFVHFEIGQSQESKQLELVQEVFQLLAPYFGQLRVVIVDGLTTCTMEFFRTALQMLGPSSRLAYFSLSKAGESEAEDDGPYIPPIDKSPFAFKNRNLSFLKLEGMQFTLDEGLDLPGLHGAELKLHLSSWDALLLFLSKSPIMRYLGVVFHSAPERPPDQLAPLLMPNLKEIKLIANVYDTLVLLGTMKLPKLRALTLNARSTAGTVFQGALEMDQGSRILPALSELSLRGEPSRRELSQLFHVCSMPRLQQVMIKELRPSPNSTPFVIPVAQEIQLNRLVPDPDQTLSVLKSINLPDVQRLKLHFRTTLLHAHLPPAEPSRLEWIHLVDLHLSAIGTEGLFRELMVVFSTSSVRNLTLGFTSQWVRAEPPIPLPEEIIPMPSIVSIGFAERTNLIFCSHALALLSLPALKDLNLDHVVIFEAASFERFCMKHAELLPNVQRLRFVSPSKWDAQLKNYVPAFLGVRNLVLGFSAAGLHEMIGFCKLHYLTYTKASSSSSDRPEKAMPFPHLEMLALHGFHMETARLPTLTSLIRELVHVRATMGQRLKRLYIKIESELDFDTTQYITERVEVFRYFTPVTDPEGKSWQTVVLADREIFGPDATLHLQSSTFWK